MSNASTHLFWITSRAAGTTALLLASASVSMGLIMAARMAKRAGADRRVYHEILALATMAAIAIHGLALLGDGYLKTSIFDVSVPFVSSYRTGWTTLGIVAGWGIVALGLAYYVRTWIGARRFKLAHRFTLLFWIAGIVHTLGEGSDAGQAWYLALLAASIAPALVLLVLRVGKLIASRSAAGSAVARGSGRATRA